MRDSKTVHLPVEVAEQVLRIGSWMQAQRGGRVYPYQVIEVICQRWLDKDEVGSLPHHLPHSGEPDA